MMPDVYLLANSLVLVGANFRCQRKHKCAQNLTDISDVDEKAEDYFVPSWLPQPLFTKLMFNMHIFR